MKVSELIKILSLMDGDMRVVVKDSSHRICDFTGFDSIDIVNDESTVDLEEFTALDYMNGVVSCDVERCLLVKG